jgi:hypothetical protein
MNLALGTRPEGRAKIAAGPDVHQRKTRPVKTAAD